jgi:DNA topoisomerase-2
LETALKLVSHKGLSTSNMHAFDERGVICKYESAEDVVREFFPVRLDGYVRRKAIHLAAMRQEVGVLEQKVAFLDHVISGRLELHRRSSGDDLDAEMERIGLERVEGSFRYLTGLAMSSMTVDRKEALEKELAARIEAVNALEATPPSKLWERDLDALDQLLDAAKVYGSG